MRVKAGVAPRFAIWLPALRHRERSEAIQGSKGGFSFVWLTRATR